MVYDSDKVNKWVVTCEQGQLEVVLLEVDNELMIDTQQSRPPS